MRITIQAVTMKTAIKSLKTIKNKIDENLKYFYGRSEISDHRYPKVFFQQEQWTIFAIENQAASYISNYQKER